MNHFGLFKKKKTTILFTIRYGMQEISAITIGILFTLIINNITIHYGRIDTLRTLNFIGVLKHNYEFNEPINFFRIQVCKMNALHHNTSTDTCISFT